MEKFEKQKMNSEVIYSSELERQEKEKYKLIRHLGFPTSKKQVHEGPVPGGKFWALEGFNDLPDKHIKQGDRFYPFVEINLNELILSGARIKR